MKVGVEHREALIVEGFGDILNCWNRYYEYKAYYYKHRKECAFVIWLKHFDRNVP